MYINSIPNWLQHLLKRYTWKGPSSEAQPKVYLTFDDGPHPEITPWVLDQLEQYAAKATFFCIGKNVIEYPGIYSQILQKEHRVGNHTHTHLKGKKTKNNLYLKDVKQAQQFINSNLFRPPYGSIKRSQANLLKAQGFEIILWTLIPGDWDHAVSPQQCLENIVFNLQPGHILVLHDSEKARANMEYVLPRLLLHCKQKGWELAPLP